ncbi:trypsin-like peptidase domain-containing protein, partial [Frankia sp. Ag45/Mut15]
MLAGVGRLLVGETPDQTAYDEEFRTGFVIAHGHVLTAAHCVRDLADEPLWLRLRPGSGRSSGSGGHPGGGRYVFVPLRVVDVDEALDGAVLALDTARVAASAQDSRALTELLTRVAVPLGVTAVRFGWDIRTEGFPASAGNPDGTVFSGTVDDPDGQVSQAGMPAPALQLLLGALGAAAPESPKGHSGGPVLHEPPTATSTDGPVTTSQNGAVAVGMVRAYPPGDETRWTALGGIVYATRLDDLARRFPPVADAVADTAQRRLEAVSPRRRTVTDSVAGLLRADAALTDFRGRTSERHNLHAWCGSSQARSAWLMTGPAGQGKTRLARQLADELDAQGGWLTGLFRGPGSLDTMREVVDAARVSGRRLLLIVDYAAEHRAAALQPLVDVLAGGEIPWRLLLLARAAGDWWTDSAHGLLSRLETVGVQVPPEPITLDLLEPTEQGRRSTFTAVAEALRAPVGEFAATRGLPFVPDPAPPSLLEKGEFGSALMLHIAAVCALLPTASPGQHPRPNGPSRPPAQPRAADLVGRILDLECRHHWLYSDDAASKLYPATREAFHQHADGPEGRRLVELAVATATLFGAANRHEATTVLSAALALKNPLETNPIARWLHDLYPPADSTDGWLPPLQPDLLGEELVARVLHQALVDDRLPATRTLPFQVLTDEQAGPPTAEQVQRMLTVLTRTATRHPTIARLLDGGPTPTSPLLAKIPAGYDLAPVEAALPTSTTNLLTFAVQLTAHNLSQHTERIRTTDGQITYPQAAELARLHNNLAGRLSSAGRRAEALAPAQEAVNLRRQLAADSPDAYLPDLA